MDPTPAHNRVIPRRARYTVQTKRRVRKRQRPDIRERVRALVAIRRVVVHDRRRLIYRRDRVVRPVARILSNVNRTIKTTIKDIVAFIATKRVTKDRAAADFMKLFHRAAANEESWSRALQEALIATREEHPYDWPNYRLLVP